MQRLQGKRARSKSTVAGTSAGSIFLGPCDDRAGSAITGVVLPIDCGFAAYSGV